MVFSQSKEFKNIKKGVFLFNKPCWVYVLFVLSAFFVRFPPRFKNIFCVLGFSFPSVFLNHLSHYKHNYLVCVSL